MASPKNHVLGLGLTSVWVGVIKSPASIQVTRGFSKESCSHCRFVGHGKTSNKAPPHRLWEDSEARLDTLLPTFLRPAESLRKWASFCSAFWIVLSPQKSSCVRGGRTVWILAQEITDSCPAEGAYDSRRCPGLGESPCFVDRRHTHTACSGRLKSILNQYPLLPEKLLSMCILLEQVM